MNVVLITGAAGLVGSEAARFFADKEYKVVGIDNDMRKVFFGSDASTVWNRRRLEEELPGYRHLSLDIRSPADMEAVFREYQEDVVMILHAAAQPSHDWAARDPMTDFSVNADGTLVLLEMTRRYCPRAVFIFTSTNKVYGDRPNFLPLVELKQRWELEKDHVYFAHGIDEYMSIDQTKHSLFGASKVAADILVQEYGRYFDMKTCVFRGGCLTGPAHSGTELHGFLAYLMKCAITGRPYTIFGYKGKQVRDNIHSYDLVNCFYHFFQKPRVAEVYNIGGGRSNSCSMLEAVEACERITGKKMNCSYSESNRVGDHVWWISDVSKFRNHYPGWDYRYNLEDILVQLYDGLSKRTG